MTIGFSLMSIEITLVLATVLHYFHIFTFHTVHYWICILAIMMLEDLGQKIKEWWRS